MKETIVAGNWKMNLSLSAGVEFAKTLAEYLEQNPPKQTKIMLGVPYIHLAEISKKLSAYATVSAQDCSQYESGAYTGEVSAAMIKSTGAAAIIIGHSERRTHHSESDEVVNAKIKQALAEELIPIFCLGEVLEDRQANRQESIVAEQLKGGLEGLEAGHLAKLIIAYEPVWAIGTGETASPEQAQDMHGFIRKYLTEYYGEALAKQVPILYGGSVKPENASAIFGKPDVNGGLIGGASLKTESFIALIEKSESL
jgi:triosephosphate isomerase